MIFSRGKAKPVDYTSELRQVEADTIRRWRNIASGVEVTPEPQQVQAAFSLGVETFEVETAQDANSGFHGSGIHNTGFANTGIPASNVMTYGAVETFDGTQTYLSEGAAYRDAGYGETSYRGDSGYSSDSSYRGESPFRSVESSFDSRQASSDPTITLIDEIVLPGSGAELQEEVNATWSTGPLMEPLAPLDDDTTLFRQPAPVVREPEPEPEEKVVPLRKVLPCDLNLPADEDLRRRFGNNIRSALGPGTVIEGTFSFDAPVCIDGTLNGEVRSSSALIVGAHANVTATVVVGSLIVLGKVTGPIQAEDLIEIRAGGALEGNISAKRLVVEDGGYYNGRCHQHS